MQYAVVGFLKEQSIQKHCNTIYKTGGAVFIYLNSLWSLAIFGILTRDFQSSCGLIPVRLCCQCFRHREGFFPDSQFFTFTYILEESLRRTHSGNYLSANTRLNRPECNEVWSCIFNQRRGLDHQLVLCVCTLLPYVHLYFTAPNSHLFFWFFWNGIVGNGGNHTLK